MAGDIIAHPLVLRGAWLRVDAWYARGEMGPQPELVHWRLDPVARLRELAADLRDGSWRPDPWLQLPYPKKGARLRHYTMPTVRDQVAFMTHMVALGPILDSQMPNFTFGNRWYQPIAWDRRNQPPQWVRRPYPILSDKTYLPYARSYGLFRRVANWTVAHMTEAPRPASDYAGRVQVPEDYPGESLPPWTRKAWWRKAGSDPRAYWAALDIELAYPSVRLARLQEAIISAARETVGLDQFAGYPASVLEALLAENVRVAIGRRLADALQEVSVTYNEIPRDAWAPPQGHRLPVVPPEKDLGIPTGLAISGLLLNVALLEADRAVERYLTDTEGERRGAIVRFADDMYVLSRSVSGVLALIEVVHGALSGMDGAALALPNSDSNICLNFNKIRPDATREVVGEYLVANGWTRCDAEGCGQPLPGQSVSSGPTIMEWWSSASERAAFALRREAVERTAIAKGDVGPFVTSLVERLSEMGTDTLQQRFGEGARGYLRRLHELARFDIADEQVREDTRRAFSVNRLVRAWLPTGGATGDDRKDVADIRETVAFVLDRTPWKFALWRAVVRSAARRPLAESNEDGDPDSEAEEWLSNQLRRIADRPDVENPTAWESAWPESGVDTGHSGERDRAWRSYYLSFHRAAFWRALAEVIRELGWHAVRSASGEDAWAPSPNLWAVRAIGDRHAAVAVWLSKIDTWADVLYRSGDSYDLADRTWELDALVGAVLAAHTTTELAHAWRRVGGPGRALTVPTTERLATMPRTISLLGGAGRLHTTEGRRGRKLDHWALANIRLGRWDTGLPEALFPSAARPRIRRAANDPRNVLNAGLALGCFERIGSKLAYAVVPLAEERVNTFQRDPLALLEYSSARRVILGQETELADEPTLHRLLWGKPGESDLRRWRTVPWETPALGLPSRVGAAFLRGAGQPTWPQGWSTRQGPLTWQIGDTDGVLVQGRSAQFDGRALTESTEGVVAITRSEDWEVLPHAAYYLPFVSLDAGRVHPASYVAYCDALLLLTALDGSELILDGLVRWGVRETPFVDRWSWRSRIHLPLDAWLALEHMLRWAESPSSDATSAANKLSEALEGWSGQTVSEVDFLAERIDVSLSARQDSEIVRTIRPAGKLHGPPLPPELRIANNIVEELGVRVGQVTAWPSSTDLLRSFPEVPSRVAHSMIEQVANVFNAPSHSSDSALPDIVVLPELSVPRQEVRSLRELVRDTHIGAVAGLYWRALHPPYRAAGGLVPTWRCFVNEAELVLPTRGDERGPTGVRWYRVRKPVPAHLEDGLAEALTKTAGIRWRMVRRKTVVPVRRLAMGRLHDRDLCRLGGRRPVEGTPRGTAASADGRLQQGRRSLRVVDVGSSIRELRQRGVSQSRQLRGFVPLDSANKTWTRTREASRR